MSISIRNIDDETFEVTVSSSATTTHAVTITDEIRQKLTGGRISKEDLLDF
jgi:hypothetical protein